MFVAQFRSFSPSSLVRLVQSETRRARLPVRARKPLAGQVLLTARTVPRRVERDDAIATRARRRLAGHVARVARGVSRRVVKEHFSQSRVRVDRRRSRLVVAFVDVARLQDVVRQQRHRPVPKPRASAERVVVVVVIVAGRRDGTGRGAHIGDAIHPRRRRRLPSSFPRAEYDETGARRVVVQGRRHQCDATREHRRVMYHTGGVPREFLKTPPV